jgi:hypothetical protein
VQLNQMISVYIHVKHVIIWHRAGD